jgi:predicted transglutaminase-like cysteine proteinase
MMLAAAWVAGCTATTQPRPSLLASTMQPAPPAFGQRDYCAAAQRRDDARDRSFRLAFCEPDGSATVVELTPRRRGDLAAVQASVAASIAYAPTPSWDPLASIGDCKTYVARMELELLERGWPAGALRIATAFVDDRGPHQNKYHAVLLVDTSEGTLALDNRYAKPQHWQELPYVWIAAQTPRPMRWVRLPADPAAVSLALAANGIGANVAGAGTGGGRRWY